jgi:Tol biopolymer transport system component
VNLEERVQDHLKTTGDQITEPQPDLTRVVSRGRRRKVGRVLSTGALIGAVLVGAALLWPVREGPPVATTIPPSNLGNGWVAFPVGGPDGDFDIYLVGFDEEAFRVAGSDSDGVDQLCPAFSADGARLAYGEAEGNRESGYSDGTMVVSDVSGDGSLSETFRVDMGPGSALPCATWSRDGEWIAVGVRNGDWGTPGDIWLVPGDNGSPIVLQGAYVSHDPPAGSLYSDLEWSPDGTELAVTGQEGIGVYSVADDDWRVLDGTRGARTLTWSPDGTEIAYEYDFDGSPDEIRLADVDGAGEMMLAGDYEALHGIGPVWSPAGDQIAYQRAFSGERHEVVLVTNEGSETVLPNIHLPEPGDDNPFWFVSRVTWSPDGSHLLYRAQATGDDALIAVPLDPEIPPVKLHEGAVAGYEEGYQLASQSWGGG